MYLRKSSNRRQEASIDEPLNTDGDGNELLLSDVLGSDENLVGLQLEQAAERATLRRSVEQLAPRERQIMELRFGLVDGVETPRRKPPMPLASARVTSPGWKSASSAP
mgnify:CR=1 FL=1